MIEIIKYYVVKCSRLCTAVVTVISATYRAVKHSCLMKANWRWNFEKPTSVTLCIVQSWQPEVIQCCVSVCTVRTMCVLVRIAMYECYAGY